MQSIVTEGALSQRPQWVVSGHGGLSGMQIVGLADSASAGHNPLMAYSFAQIHIRRRRPYERYRRARWRFVFRREGASRPPYEPWGAREGFPHPLEAIPGYWVREIGPRFQQGSYSRCFNRGKFSRFTDVR